MIPTETGKISGSHPSLEVLAAYHEEKLSQAEHGSVQNHLESCSHCAGIILDLESFERISADASEVKTDQSWPSLKLALDERSAIEPPDTPKSLATLERPRSSYLLRAWAIAATIATLLLTSSSLWLVAKLRSVQEPQVASTLISLSPEGDLRPSPSEPEVKVTITHGRRPWLILNSHALTDYENLRVRFVALPEQSVQWEIDGFVADDRRSLRLELSSHRIPSGRYRIELLGRFRDSPKEGWAPIATYALELKVIPPP